MKVNWEEVFTRYETLDTDRCYLRPVTLRDARAVFRLMGNPDVTKYLGRHPLPDVEAAKKTVERYLAQYEEKRGMVWMICDRTEKRVIGNCLIFNLIQPHCRAEIGYALEPDWWGKGIMSEVLPIAIEFAFESMQLHSLFAQIDPENHASRRLLEKYGFVQEAYFREDFYHPVLEKFTDTVILSLLESTWKNRS